MNETPNWPRIRNLPEHERLLFKGWLVGQTRPYLEGEPDNEQDGFYYRDYERWKLGLPIID